MVINVEEDEGLGTTSSSRSTLRSGDGVKTKTSPTNTHTDTEKHRDTTHAHEDNQTDRHAVETSKRRMEHAPRAPNRGAPKPHDTTRHERGAIGGAWAVPPNPPAHFPAPPHTCTLLRHYDHAVSHDTLPGHASETPSSPHHHHVDGVRPSGRRRLRGSPCPFALARRGGLGQREREEAAVLGYTPRRRRLQPYLSDGCTFEWGVGE